MKKTILFAIALGTLLCASCSDWTTPENLQYIPESPKEKDPEAYGKALAAVKDYKLSKHNLMIVTMMGTSEKPYARPQHLMNMPDSADIICVKNAIGLHSSLVAEIAEVYEVKGTRSVSYVDYASIDEAWTLIEDEKSEKGEPEASEDEITAFFKAEAAKQVAACDDNGFAGIMVSYEGNVANSKLLAKQTGFLSAVTDWRKTHSDAILILKGSLRNINYSDKTRPLYNDLIDGSDYLIVTSDEVAAPTQLNLRINQMVRNFSKSEAKDRIILEVSVPSADTPEQKGASPQDAAQWYLDCKSGSYNGNNFTPLGLCVGNAHDDYYRQDLIYKNIRQAISIMNPSPDDNKELEN